MSKTIMTDKVIKKLSVSLFLPELDPNDDSTFIPAFHRAEEIGKKIADMGQGAVLLAAKKYYCGSEWNAKSLSDKVRPKWKTFLVQLELWREEYDKPKANVNYLLDFVGYKEAGGEIETSSQYREVKKIAKQIEPDLKQEDLPEAIDNIYKEIGGPANTTAKAIKEAGSELLVEKSKEDPKMVETVMISLAYKNAFGKPPEHKYGNAFGIDKDMVEALPTISRKEWKKIYLKLSNLLHPDKGGSADEMAVISQFNKTLEIRFVYEDTKKKRQEWTDNLRAWEKEYNLSGISDTKFKVENAIEKEKKKRTK